MKSDQINELAKDLAKAQSQIKSALKESSNPYFKSKYADLHSTWEACRSALNENGLSVVQIIECSLSTQRTDIEYKIDPRLVTTLLHISGQWISGECPLLNLKGDMQGLGSAISYARRYSIAAICGVVTEDDDASTADLKSSGDIKSPSKASPIMGEYIIPLKKFQGQRLSELKEMEILNYIDWIKREGITKPDYLTFIREAEKYLKQQMPPDDIHWPQSG